MADTTTQLGSSIQSLLSAMASGNASAAQEAIRQFNLTYTNQVAEQYGQNFGVGQPGPPARRRWPRAGDGGRRLHPRLTSGTQASQSMANLAGQAGRAGRGRSDGLVRRAAQSQYTPGTFVAPRPEYVRFRHPGATQISYVLPSGSCSG